VVDRGSTGPDGSAALDDLDTEALASPGAADDAVPDLPPGFGLAVISGLVEDVEVTSDPQGTHVVMTWPATDVMAPDAG
jgi:hypothetical protein